jgi:hypothetical protein
VESGDNLLQYCYVRYVFRIISNIGLFVSVKSVIHLLLL